MQASFKIFGCTPRHFAEIQGVTNAVLCPRNEFTFVRNEFLLTILAACNKKSLALHVGLKNLHDNRIPCHLLRYGQISIQAFRLGTHTHNFQLI